MCLQTLLFWFLWMTNFILELPSCLIPISNSHSLEIAVNLQSYFLGTEESVITRLICPSVWELSLSSSKLQCPFFNPRVFPYTSSWENIFPILRICEDFIIFLNKRKHYKTENLFDLPSQFYFSSTQSHYHAFDVHFSVCHSSIYLCIYK